jgi:hypothetical protein
LAISAGVASIGHATIIGFGELGGSNTQIPTSLGSNASVDGSGYSIGGNATPNIALTWDSAWDIHTSSWFMDLENKTDGGNDWDYEAGTYKIAQLDADNHTITFSADEGYALVLESFDFGHTAETIGTTIWDLALTDSSSKTVWSQQLTMDNESTEDSIFTISPNFTGELGESYTLSFDLNDETYNSGGRHAIDNLTFAQIPEPSTITLLGGVGVVLVFIRRRFSR